VFQLHRFITSMSKYHTDCYSTMKSIINIFPIEVDLPVGFNDIISNNNNNNEASNRYSDEYDESDENDDNEEGNDNGHGHGGAYLANGGQQQPSQQQTLTNLIDISTNQ
jgi:hypothetical protein